jgi:hypothetical protein
MQVKTLGTRHLKRKAPRLHLGQTFTYIKKNSLLNISYIIHPLQLKSNLNQILYLDPSHV